MTRTLFCVSLRRRKTAVPASSLLLLPRTLWLALIPRLAAPCIDLSPLSLATNANSRSALIMRRAKFRLSLGIL